MTSEEAKKRVETWNALSKEQRHEIIAGVFRKQVESCKDMVKFDSEQIAWANDMLKLHRADRVPDVEMITYYTKERRRYYREREKDRERLREAEERLKRWS